MDRRHVSWLTPSRGRCGGVSFLIRSPHTLPKLAVRFFRTDQGTEPVRDWLKRLQPDDRRRIGDEIRTLQFGWPVGMPLVRKLGAELWEVRVRLDRRIARVLFTLVEGEAVLLHGFIKKSQKTPATEMNTARERLSLLKAPRKLESWKR
jgi:phage-related protein